MRQSPPRFLSKGRIATPTSEFPLPSQVLSIPCSRIMTVEDLLRSSGQLRATTLSVMNRHHYGELYINYLKARHAVFIVTKRWKLPEVDGMEYDQYDTPEARWVVVHEYGEVLAGLRMTPTTSRCGAHTYMIRDAQLGLLKGLPLDPLYFEAPVADHIWEGTRLFVSDKIPASRRVEIQTLLMMQMAETARSLEVTQMIGVVPVVFRRWLKRIDMQAVAVGPAFELGGDWSQAALMTIG